MEDRNYVCIERERLEAYARAHQIAECLHRLLKERAAKYGGLSAL